MDEKKDCFSSLHAVAVILKCFKQKLTSHKAQESPCYRSIAHLGHLCIRRLTQTKCTADTYCVLTRTQSKPTKTNSPEYHH